MKNEIQLKEELLLLEAEYSDIFNKSQEKGFTYWFDKDKQYRAKMLSTTISKCKKEIELLSKAKDLQSQIETLQIMKKEMIQSMKHAEFIPPTFKNRLEKLDNELALLQETYDSLFVTR